MKHNPDPLIVFVQLHFCQLAENIRGPALFHVRKQRLCCPLVPVDFFKSLAVFFLVVVSSRGSESIVMPGGSNL